MEKKDRLWYEKKYISKLEKMNALKNDDELEEARDDLNEFKNNGFYASSKAGSLSKEEFFESENNKNYRKFVTKNASHMDEVIDGNKSAEKEVKRVKRKIVFRRFVKIVGGIAIVGLIAYGVHSCNKNKNNTKVIAIGEIGIDFYWTKENSDKQIYFFKKQLELAKKYDLPVIVHAREASQKVFDIIKESNVRKGSMHCYSGSTELAKEYIKLGFYIGIDGPVTYPNNKKGIDLITNIPVKNLLLETDSPYLSPESKRGQVNTPLNLKEIAEKVSEVKEIPIEEIIDITYNNAKKLFNLEE